MIILLVLPTVMADATPLMLVFDGACDNNECDLVGLFEWVQTEYGVEVIESITVDVSEFEGLTVSGFGDDGSDMIQLNGPVNYDKLSEAGYSIIQFRADADMDIDDWNGDRDMITPAEYSKLPGVSIVIDVGGTVTTDTGFFLSLAPEGYIPSIESIDVEPTSPIIVDPDDATTVTLDEEDSEDEEGESTCLDDYESCLPFSCDKTLTDDELNSLIYKVEQYGGAGFQSLDEDAEWAHSNGNELSRTVYSVRYGQYPYLPVSARGAAVASDGIVTCDHLEDLPTDALYYHLIADFTGYGCSGVLRIPGFDTEYTLPGTKSCIEDLKIGRYDVDGDGEYDLSDMIAYLQWSLLHKVNDFTAVLYPLDATELDSSSTSIWG